MSEELTRFFDKIGLKDYNVGEFINTKILKVVVNKKNSSFKVFLQFEDLISFNELEKLDKARENGLAEKELLIDYSYENISDEKLLKFIIEVLDSLKKNKPSLKSLENESIKLDNKKIILEASSNFEKEIFAETCDYIIKVLNKYNVLDINYEVTINEEENLKIKKEIKEDKKSNPLLEQKKEVVIEAKEFTIKDPTSYKDTIINNIIGETKKVAIEAYIFGIDTLERDNINIITIKISDKTNSIIAKIFKKKKEEYQQVLSCLKEGNWYKFYGNIEYDNFSKDLILSTKDFEKVTKEEEQVKDDALEPRVELHLHTMMSAMDSVVPMDDVVKYAVDMGHKAIAVTDHNGCQSFPNLFHAVEAYNKGKEKEDRFKVLYGVEMNIVNNDVDLIFNNKTYDLLEQEYVVFDTETTGFYAGSDQMIEIGAVKIKNGEITDRFDELIDPHRPLPKKITELTFITDEMLKGCPSEEEITNKFLNWVGNLPLVAHNAKFDISFMKAACQKYGFEEFNKTVLDTMSIARMLYPNWPNHKLQTLTKNLDVPWDEDKHHRADYDAEGTAIAFYKMAKVLESQNISTTDQLIDNIDKEKLVRFSYPFHATLIAKDRTGLKNMFKIISIANTKYLYKNEQPKIPRDEVIKLREGLLIGSGCINGEVFDKAGVLEDEELVNMMDFYDYIEVQPVSAFTHLIGYERKFASELEAQEYLKRIIRVAKEAGKPVVATGDVHNLRKEDKLYREIIINQRFNGKLHPLNRKGIEVPNMYLKTTAEMLEDFSFLDEDVAKEIVVTNPNKIANMISEIEVIIDTPKPFAPKIPNSIETMTKLVYEKAHSLYGDVLPHHIEERLATELYGDALRNAITENIKKEKLSEKDEEDKIYKILHETIVSGYESVKKYIEDYLKETEEEELTPDALDQAVKKKLGGIIGAGYDVIYLIAQKLVKHSNDDGYLVGSRGSVGSSLVAFMMGITEVNSLAPHYRCPECKTSIFDDKDNEPLGSKYLSGYDLPDKKCPNCKIPMVKDGQDIPFATFLGFNADKVPDIDLNFSELNQAATHEYTKELFGVDNVYRAGTIGTVAEKTAFGYVRGYCEDKNITMRNIEVERLAIGCTGCKRTTGQHPGGIVVIPDYMDVYDFTPYQFPAEDPDSAWRTTHFDYHAIDADVLKLDILGHTDPTQLRMIQDLTGDDVTQVPLDDKETMSIFTSTKALGVTPEQIMCDVGTLGVPEFGTPFTIQLVKDTKPTTFAEIIKISGLAHGTDVWLGNAQDLIARKIVPFKEVIGCRDDIMVSLMYKGLPPFKAFKIMEFVRKGRASKPKDKAEWEEHVKLMKEYDVPKWFIESCAKIKYMFPKAHASAYVTSAFRIAWYKVHKPLVYYASYFSTRFQDFDIDAMTKGYEAIKAKMLEIQSKGYDATNKEQSLLETLKLALEATARGFKFKKIDIKKSEAKDFVMDEEDNALIMPFMSVDGLGDAVAFKIVEERNKKDFYSIEDFQNRGKVNSSTIDKLRSLDIFEGMPESSQLSLF